MRDQRIPARTRDLVTVVRDIGYVSFGKYGQYFVTTVTLPLIARVLGAEGLGLLAIGMSSYFIGSVIGDLGITSYLSAKVNDSGLNQLRGNYLAIRASILVVIGTALIVSMAVGVEAHVHMILLGLLAGGISSISEDWVLIGQGRFGASMAYQAVGRVGYLVLLLVLLPHFANPSIPLWSLLVSSLVTAALTWRDSLRNFGRPSRPRDVGAMLRMGAPVLTSRLLVTTYGQGAATVYSSVLDATSLGLFSAGDRLVRATQSLLDPIGFALLPRMARKSRDQFWRHVIQALLACLCVAVIATATIWIAAPVLVNVIFGSEFANAIPLLRVEVLILPATALTSFVTTAVLTVRQDTSGVLIGALIGTCIAATALVIAYTNHSVWTLVYGTVGAEFAVALWYVIRMRWLFLRGRLAHEAEVTAPAIEPAHQESTS